MANQKIGKLGVRPIIIGEIWHSEKWGDFKILNEYKIDLGYKNQTFYDIQYLDTGTVVKKVQNSAIRLGSITDTYKPNFYGVGYLGGFQSPTNPKNEVLYKRWLSMLSRCYNTNDKAYCNYGKIGVFVDYNWHNFTNFYNDLIKKENYQNLLSEDSRLWQIDKDIICNKSKFNPHYYSNETVKIIHISENSSESNTRMNKFTLKNMRGVYYDSKCSHGECYKVTYSNKDKNISKHKSFSINKYGKEEAKELAIKQRLKWEQMYGGASSE